MKRFTDTDKWRDPWFRKLSAGAKLAFYYIVENCDNSGVWSADTELADFTIGMKIPWDKVLEDFGNRMEILPNGEWLVRKFVAFQYGRLSEDCKPHLQVLRLIENHRVSKGYPRGLNTLEDKEKEKDKDKKGSVMGKPDSREAAHEYGKEISMQPADVDSWFDHFESNGWRVSGKAAMKDWKAAMRNGKRMAPTFNNGSRPITPRPAVAYEGPRGGL